MPTKKPELDKLSTSELREARVNAEMMAVEPAVNEKNRRKAEAELREVFDERARREEEALRSALETGETHLLESDDPEYGEDEEELYEWIDRLEEQEALEYDEQDEEEALPQGTIEIGDKTDDSLADEFFEWALGDYYHSSKKYTGSFNPLHYLDSWVVIPAKKKKRPVHSSPPKDEPPTAKSGELPGIGGVGSLTFVAPYVPQNMAEARAARDLILLELELFGMYFGEIPMASTLIRLLPRLIRSGKKPVIQLGKAMTKEGVEAAKVTMASAAKLMRQIRDLTTALHKGAQLGKQNVAIGIWTTRSGRQVIEVSIKGAKKDEIWAIINKFKDKIDLPKGYSLRPAAASGYKDHAELLLKPKSWMQDSLYGWCSDCLETIACTRKGSFLILARGGGKTKALRAKAEALRKELIKLRLLRQAPGAH